MKARDLFGVVVRSVGLCLLLICAWYLAYAAASLFNLVPELRPDWYMGTQFLATSPGVLAGFILLRFARPIVRFCYPEGKDDSEE